MDQESRLCSCVRSAAPTTVMVSANREMARHEPFVSKGTASVAVTGRARPVPEIPRADPLAAGQFWEGVSQQVGH